MASASPADGESLLASSTLATLDPKTNTLVTSGESSVGRVSLGGGQIVIEGIHVTASIANDGTPSYKAAVSVASATIGGVPVTIDQDGVHVATQGAGLPYQQASDALNGALKQAGIQLFLVGPEVTTPCGQTGTGTGTSTTTTTTTTTTSSDQSGTTSSPSSCDQTASTTGCDSSGAGSGGGTGPSLPSPGGSSTTTTTSSNQTTTQSSCDQTGANAACGQNGTTTNGTTTTDGVTAIGPSTTTTTTSTDKTSPTTMPSGCDQPGTLPSTSSCAKTGTATGTTSTSTDQMGTTAAPPSPFDFMGGAGGNSGASEETVRATGVHLVFTQPVNQSGVPAQYVEHILGEVFVDSLAVPAGNPPNLDLSFSSSSSSSASSSCGGLHSSTASSGASAAGGGSSTAGGGSSVGGLTASGASSPSGSTLGSTLQPASSSTGNSLPAAFAAALRKPLWLLLAYVLWQALVIGTGASLWNWRRDGAS
jgi:hypothetical protein